MKDSIKKIVVIGPECTGKSELSNFLANHYKTEWVPEYARSYLDNLARPYNHSDLLSIARGQLRLEDKSAISANRLLICDTDVLATKIWYERYLQMPAPWIPIAPSRIALYVVPFPDTPYVQDEIRDAEHLRFWMYERFVEEIEKLGVPHVVLQGTFDERYEQAIAAIDALDESEREA